MKRPRKKSRTPGWHPAWFVPGARCTSRGQIWSGTVVGFEDGPHQEHGVVETDDGIRVSSPLTHGLDPITKMKDPSRVYFVVRVQRSRRWLAECHGRVASIPHPRSLKLIEAAVKKVARNAFRDYLDGSIRPVVVEPEIRGHTYLASISILSVGPL